MTKFEARWPREQTEVDPIVELELDDVKAAKYRDLTPEQQRIILQVSREARIIVESQHDGELAKAELQRAANLGDVFKEEIVRSASGLGPAALELVPMIALEFLPPQSVKSPVAQAS